MSKESNPPPTKKFGTWLYKATLQEPIKAYYSAIRYNAMNNLLQNRTVTNLMSKIPGLRNVYESAAKAYKAKERF